MTIPSASKGALETGGVSTSPSVKIFPLQGPQNLRNISSIDIIDIRHDAVEINLKDEIFTSLRPESGLKTLPTLLLYDEQGLQLFEEVGTKSQVTGSGSSKLTRVRSHIWKSTILQMRKLMS